MHRARYALHALFATTVLGLAAFAHTQNPPTAKVRIIHASPDAPAVDILLDGNKALENVSYKTASKYLPVPPGTHQLKVVPTGQQSAVIDTSIMLAPGQSYTALAVGLTKDSSLKPLLLNDAIGRGRRQSGDNNGGNHDDNANDNAGNGNTTPDAAVPDKTKAHVRMIYAVPDGPPIDIVVAGDKPIYIAKGLTANTASAYLTAPEGTYNVEIRLAGKYEAVKKLDAVMLKAGTDYSVIAFGQASDPGSIDVQTLTDETSVRRRMRRRAGDANDTSSPDTKPNPDSGSGTDAKPGTGTNPPRK